MLRLAPVRDWSNLHTFCHSSLPSHQCLLKNVVPRVPLLPMLSSKFVKLEEMQPDDLKNADGMLGIGVERGLHTQKNFLSGPHRFCGASTSLSPLPLENTGLSIVPPIRKGNCNLPAFKVAPDSRAMVLAKKLSLVVISANP